MPIEPAADSLITVEEYLAYMGTDDPSSATIKRDHYQMLINMVSTRVQKYCGRLFRTGTDLGETFTGDDSREYRVHNWPLISVSEIAYWNAGSQSWDEATTASYPRTVDTRHNRVYFNAGAIFSRYMGKDGWRVTYSYGSNLGDMDQDLVMVCCQLVQRARLKSVKHMEAMTSRTIAEETQAFDLSTWPADIKATLARFKRPSFG